MCCVAQFDVISSLRAGYGKGEGGALSASALDADSSAVSFHDLFHDGQSKAGPGLLGAGHVLFENFWQHLGGDAWTIVLHAASVRARGNADLPIWDVFEGIGEQVFNWTRALASGA